MGWAFEKEHVRETTLTNNLSKFGGRLRLFINEWTKIISDKNILQIVKGYKIPFDSTVKQYFIPKVANIDNSATFSQFITTTHFKLEDIRTSTKLISRNCFMCSIDLKDGYLTIYISSEFTKYFRFTFLDQIYEFTSLLLVYQLLSMSLLN